ncbi:MAG: pyrimidine 5'-nucleotidase [Chloroflexi bacterium]|nr:MAG: pyrimidine 5'-nucleotidase [Chloroflexota bacterium]MBL1193334.1 pyrimidine 5'-nucleotidase [Chloroflexota bacterium]NOH10626.1 pyrimidine 5'-nucleotidase [Chloroflexota bacterium]
MSTQKPDGISTYFLDLDGTFYANSLGMWEAISERINAFLERHMGFDKAAIDKAREDYYVQYGTTLRGLMLHHEVDPLEYLAYVHNVPLDDYLTPNPAIQKALEALPGTKWIFTNADTAHAKRVLEAVGVSLDLFAGFIDVVRTDYVNKPDEAAYRKALEIAGGPPPSTCVMVDDQDRNLAPSRRLGMHTVLVGPDVEDRAAHTNIAELHQLPAALNGLLE